MIAATIMQPDFSSSYGNKHLSDVTLVIYEEPGPDEQSLGTKRAAPAVAEELPGHGVVLIAMSGYCRAALESWTRSSSDGKFRLDLPVPSGALELGKLLVKWMYCLRLDFSDISQQQLLQVLLLADRYEVPVVLAAAAAAFESIPSALLQWDTAMSIYNLPPGCAGLEACDGLYKIAATKVELELHDLELVWDDQEDKLDQQRLLDLPHKALKQLLESPRTSVNSENTVCFTILAWHEHQQKSKQQPSQQEMKQLLELIRMRHCSQLYVATVLAEHQLVQQLFSASARSIAAVVATEDSETLLNKSQPVLQQYPSWLAESRPKSGGQEIIRWRVPLSQVKQLVDQSHEDSNTTNRLLGPLCVWQGRKLQPVVYCSSSEGAEATACLSWLIQVQDLVGGGLCSMNIQCFALILPNQRRPLVPMIRTVPEDFLFSMECSAWGSRSFIKLGSISTWESVLQALSTQRLIHPATGTSSSSSCSEEYIDLMWRIRNLQ